MDKISPSHVVLTKDEFEKLQKQIENYEQVLNSKLIIKEITDSVYDPRTDRIFQNLGIVKWTYIDPEEYVKEFSYLQERIQRLNKDYITMQNDYLPKRDKIEWIVESLNKSIFGRLYMKFNYIDAREILKKAD